MKTCYNCGKSYLVGGTRKLLRAHYNPTASSHKQSNLQWADISGVKGRVKLCVKCKRKIGKKSAAK